MSLTDLALRRAKLTDRTQKLADGAGLNLLITPNGDRWWRFRYRLDGKEKLLSLGTYPDVPLSTARQRRDEARQLLSNGWTPAGTARRPAAARAVLGANTFEVIAREWLEKRDWVEDYRVKVVG